MPLEFMGDAICLSGLTGTKLKSEVIGKYYPFWWKITSGGPRTYYRFPTAIIELNAATGEVFIEDTEETVLGSSGHALDLKMSEAPNTQNLRIILIEEHPECYMHLKRVIRRRWRNIPVDEAEGPITSNHSNVYLIHGTLQEALEEIQDIELGNALYFFDPLRSVELSTIEEVARQRIDTFYKTGTEFIIFVFTSDWFLGRDDFAPLPSSPNKSDWSEEEYATVKEADSLFGDKKWRAAVLNDKPIKDRQRILIALYRKRLHKWFRYVLPMPFNPKHNQTFHIVLSSNYEAGVRATKNFYCNITDNPRYSPNNRRVYERFCRFHPRILRGLTGNKRPLQWLVLWAIIRDHEEGICDSKCNDLTKIEPDSENRQRLLDWLENNGYLKRFIHENAWDSGIKQYVLNWETLARRFEIAPPPPLKPLSSGDVLK
jgi:three-Cys-motif partner protein